MSGFDYSGLWQLQRQMQTVEREFDTFLRRFLLRMALEAVNRAKANTPVDTGLLRAAWTVGDGLAVARGKWDKEKGKVTYREEEAHAQAATLNSVTRRGDSLVITISNPIEYASYVEYGHTTRNREGWVEGHFMATLAIDEVAQLIPAQFQREFAAWLASLAQ